MNSLRLSSSSQHVRIISTTETRNGGASRRASHSREKEKNESVRLLWPGNNSGIKLSLRLSLRRARRELSARYLDRLRRAGTELGLDTAREKQTHEGDSSRRLSDANASLKTSINVPGRDVKSTSVHYTCNAGVIWNYNAPVSHY